MYRWLWSLSSYRHWFRYAHGDFISHTVYTAIIYLHIECLSKYSVTIATVVLFFFFFFLTRWPVRSKNGLISISLWQISVHRCTLWNIISPIIFLPHNIVFQERAKGLNSRAFFVCLFSQFFYNWENRNKLVSKNKNHDV